MKERPSVVRPIFFALMIGSVWAAAHIVIDYFHGEFEPKHETRIVYAPER